MGFALTLAYLWSVYLSTVGPSEMFYIFHLNYIALWGLIGQPGQENTENAWTAPVEYHFIPRGKDQPDHRDYSLAADKSFYIVSHLASLPSRAQSQSMGLNIAEVMNQNNKHICFLSPWLLQIVMRPPYINPRDHLPMTTLAQRTAVGLPMHMLC